MKYDNITRAIFLNRPNRFIAEVEIDGRREIVHVKNTGRCKELLIPGCEVWLTAPGTPGRKTKYDLVAVRKSNGILFNIDSQAPNKVVKEWLDRQNYDKVIPEYTYGASRIDFYMERGNDRNAVHSAEHHAGYSAVHDAERGIERYLMEVKGCTLEVDGIGYFPDAPTSRGVKHLHELTLAANKGYKAMLAFVIQMDGVSEVRPNIDTHAEFGIALDEARAAGVEVLYLKCHVEPGSLEIID
ncbi:sugar fermentation stimulation protein A [Lachnospiraceae bacterium RM5]|nr:sugar fermentation stimulation protein A [Lachnospiraceae bacterium RM5]